MGWGGGRVEEGADNTYLLSKRNSISKLQLISYKCMCLWRQLKSSLHLLSKWRAAFELCILVWRPSLIANGGHRLCSFMFLREVSRGTAVILVHSRVGTYSAHSLIWANQVIKCSVAMWADTFGNLTLGVLVCGCTYALLVHCTGLCCLLWPVQTHQTGLTSIIQSPTNPCMGTVSWRRCYWEGQSSVVVWSRTKKSAFIV